jgi:tetratricopeptide (TPR) repeat protein
MKKLICFDTPFASVTVTFLNLVVFNCFGQSMDDSMEEFRAHLRYTDEYYAKGKEYFYSGNYAEAKRQFEKAVRLTPWRYSAHGFLGQIYLKYYRDYDKAIKHLKIAASSKIKGHRQIPLYYLALSYEGAGKFWQALHTWEDYLKVCKRGTHWEEEARMHYKDLKSKLRERK